jgi:hypothetical protein
MSEDYDTDIVVSKFNLNRIVTECLESLDINDDVINSLITDITMLFTIGSSNISITLDIPTINIQTNVNNISHVMKMILYWCEVPISSKITALSDEQNREQIRKLVKKFKSMIATKYDKNAYSISISHCKLEIKN